MLTLSLRCTPELPVEAEILVPDRLRGRSSIEIARLEMYLGNQRLCLGDLFNVHGELDDGILEVQGDCSRIKRIGEGMLDGTLRIEGNAGMHLGSRMRGGNIWVSGDVGDWAGAEMRGGLIHVRGSVGDCCGAAYRGATRGMRGGIIRVDGSAGHEVGIQMRRGLICIGGDTGDGLGMGMIAGSLVVVGKSGMQLGAGMKRGTILILGSEPRLPPTFRYDCCDRFNFLDLFFRYLRENRFPLPEGVEHGTYRRFSGDLLTVGKGEVFCR